MKVIITSGGTTEAIDAVRSITNHSTGQLGKQIADYFLKQGHAVTLVTTTQAIKPQPHQSLTIYTVKNVASLLTTLEDLVPKHDCIIHSMAVSDYTPIYMTQLEELMASSDLSEFVTKKNTAKKIPSQADYQVLFLKKTPKIISLIKSWNPAITLIGFKLLVDVSKEELIAVARESLEKNQAAYILANDLTTITATQHHAYLVGAEANFEANTKADIAKLIYEKVTDYDQTHHPRRNR